jgi:hypothetical protein
MRRNHEAVVRIQVTVSDQVLTGVGAPLRTAGGKLRPRLRHHDACLRSWPLGCAAARRREAASKGTKHGDRASSTTERAPHEWAAEVVHSCRPADPHCQCL